MGFDWARLTVEDNEVRNALKVRLLCTATDKLLGGPHTLDQVNE